MVVEPLYTVIADPAVARPRGAEARASFAIFEFHESTVDRDHGRHDQATLDFSIWDLLLYYIVWRLTGFRNNAWVV